MYLQTLHQDHQFDKDHSFRRPIGTMGIERQKEDQCGKQGQPGKKKMEMLGIERFSLPFPNCEQVIGVGAGKVLIHNACDPHLFVRFPTL